MLNFLRSRGALVGLFAWFVGVGLSPLVTLHIALEHLPTCPEASNTTLVSLVDEHHHDADHDHAVAVSAVAQGERSMHRQLAAILAGPSGSPAFSHTPPLLGTPILASPPTHRSTLAETHVLLI